MKNTAQTMKRRSGIKKLCIIVGIVFVLYMAFFPIPIRVVRHMPAVILADDMGGMTSTAIDINGWYYLYALKYDEFHGSLQVDDASHHLPHGSISQLMIDNDWNPMFVNANEGYIKSPGSTRSGILMQRITLALDNTDGSITYICAPASVSDDIDDIAKEFGVRVDAN